MQIMAAGSIYHYLNNRPSLGLDDDIFWWKYGDNGNPCSAVVVTNTKTFMASSQSQQLSTQVQLSNEEKKLWSNGLNGV